MPSSGGITKISPCALRSSLARLLLGGLLVLLVSYIDSSGKNLQPESGGEKTADLSKLINETLAINNSNNKVKSTTNFRDDWTFDRVEYDLIEFLQELNARYQRGNNSRPTVSNNFEVDSENSKSVDSKLAAKSQLGSETGSNLITSTSKPENQQQQQQQKQEQNFSSKNETAVDREQHLTTLESVTNKTTSAPKQLPVSLASGDHLEISESNWQYGIFDRFTRARGPASTTPSPHHIASGATADPYAASSSSNIDVRSFNSDECGLRTYTQDEPGVAMFPASDLAPLSDFDAASPSYAGPGSEARKELAQRRQRPPAQLANVNGTQLRRKVTQPADEAQLEGDKHTVSLDPISDPLFAGEPVIGNDGSLAPDEEDNHQTASTASEFNLHSRRQWLQQQLGNTLQLLGFNVSSQSPSEFLNQTSGSSVNLRENMMKKSGLLMASVQQKSSKSLASSDSVQSSDLSLIKELDQLKARQDELKLEARVIGGTDARLGDSPWSVSLQALVARPGTGGVEYRHYCGGTIISEYYVLTAAHCLDFMVGRESRLFVVMGDLNWRMSTSSIYGQRYGIDKLIIHSGYKSTAFGHDIGLIKTRDPIKPVRVNGRYIINSVCLPERNIEHSGEAELVGWGLFSNRNEMADSLQIADVPILPRPLCVDLYRRRTGLIQWLIGIELITDKQVCAGTFGRGICQGDSGSALVFNEKVTKHRLASSPDGRAATTRVRSNLAKDQQSRATIIGVVAFGGIRRCSYQSLPGVYMQTSKYLDWILPRISA